MGWGGYGLYDGDGTQTCHYNFLKWSGLRVTDDDIMPWLEYGGTKIPTELIPVFVKGLPKVIKRMPKNLRTGKWEDDDNAIEWQMLLSLCMDNKITPPKKIYDMGIDATKWLSGEHADLFTEPRRRKSILRGFIAKAKRRGYV